MGPSSAERDGEGEERAAALERESDISRLMQAGSLALSAKQARQPKDVVTTVKPWQLQVCALQHLAKYLV